jgi:hypothetical protein
VVSANGEHNADIDSVYEIIVCGIQNGVLYAVID